jgi:hypothetical protein
MGFLGQYLLNLKVWLFLSYKLLELFLFNSLCIVFDDSLLTAVNRGSILFLFLDLLLLLLLSFLFFGFRNKLLLLFFIIVFLLSSAIFFFVDLTNENDGIFLYIEL